MEKAVVDVADQILVEILVVDDEGDEEHEATNTTTTITSASYGSAMTANNNTGDTNLSSSSSSSNNNRSSGNRTRGGMIDILKYVDFVRDPSCGAIATFQGTTRDHFEGKGVVELRYEAYVPMALRQLRSICSSALSSFKSLCKVAVVHRLGIVPVGEGSVFVAASAVHRADALEACRYVIDQLKASVPIWKKEVYADDGGEVWKRNSEFSLNKTNNDMTGGCCCSSAPPSLPPPTTDTTTASTRKEGKIS